MVCQWKLSVRFNPRPRVGGYEKWRQDHFDQAGFNPRPRVGGYIDVLTGPSLSAVSIHAPV